MHCRYVHKKLHMTYKRCIPCNLRLESSCDLTAIDNVMFFFKLMKQSLGEYKTSLATFWPVLILSHNQVIGKGVKNPIY